jgi:hypothetical protein
MEVLNEKNLRRIGNSTGCQAAICIAVLSLMGNLNALVDAAIHPDIPYFDEEHLIVGGVTALVSTIICLISLIYVRYLNKAMTTIQTLEGLLPICAYCKSIRKPDADPAETDSWQQLEEYVSERTASQFTHGICPKCMAENFPEAYVQIMGKQPEV